MKPLGKRGRHPAKALAPRVALATAPAPAPDPQAAARAAARLLRVATEALPPELAHLAHGKLAGPLGQAVEYAQASLAGTTMKIYEDDWRAFTDWCASHGAPSLPAPPAIVAAYLAHRAGTLGRSGLRLVLAAIGYHHRRAGYAWAPGDPVIANTMRGILRTQKRKVRPAAALTSDEIRLLLASCPDGGGRAGLPALRDRALLLTGFAGALRRSELAALDIGDLRFNAEGVTLKIRFSKRDQEGEGASVGIPFGQHPDTCPVLALKAWLARARITAGPVFRRVSATGRVGDGLTGNGIWQILRAIAKRAGLQPPEGERLSPHGLRAGFITEAYLNGALDEQVAHHARQKDLKTTQAYRRRAKTVAASPARLLNL
jgi:integrase